MSSKRLQVISSLLLLMTAMIWGVAFVAQSVGMQYVGPWTFVCTRYILSSLVLIPVSMIAERRVRTAARERGEEKRAAVPFSAYLKGGLFCGGCLGTASILQQSGIRYTTAGKAGFITALYVVLVPLLGLFLGKKPEKKIWFCVALGVAGLYLISVKENFTIGGGDLQIILCAVMFAFQILNVAQFSAVLPNPVRLANMQFAVSAVIGLAGMLLFEHPQIAQIRVAALPILYAGIFSGAVGYTLQIVAQKYTDPTVASLLMCLESVFSVLAGWVILRQGLTAREGMGCVLMFAAALLAEIPVSALRRKRFSVF